MPNAAHTLPSIEQACADALTSFRAWARADPSDRAATLEALADALDGRRADLIASAAAETALTPDELAPEFERTTATFRLFANVLRRGTWFLPAIDTPGPSGAAPIGPNHDLRRTLVPLGPVAVFGAGNFPLAYGVCGGDTASALAAGCAVIVKEHPAHPATGRLIASIARAALAPRAGLLGYIANEDPRDHSAAAALIAAPAVAAVGFTGSVRAGLAIERLARQRPVPIPVFAEMGSSNPILCTPAAARAAELGDSIANSILARFGQQCTAPGLVFLPRDAHAALNALRTRIEQAPARRMLAPWVRDNYLARLNEVAATPGVVPFALGLQPQSPADPRAAHAALFRCDLAAFARQPSLHDEIFGPGAIIITYDDPRELLTVELPASLTLTLNFDPADAADTALCLALADHFAARAGRLIFNGVPTGVRVAHAMVHGGPFPATNRPDSTAVGPFAISRWCRPLCYQNAPPALLPPALRNDNPLGLPRLVNGRFTSEPA